MAEVDLFDYFFEDAFELVFCVGQVANRADFGVVDLFQFG